MVYIIAVDDDGKERRVEVRNRAEVYRENLEVVVEADGKKEGLGVKDITVSRRRGAKAHLELVCRADGYFIKDTGSKNGTKVDGNLLPGWSESRPSNELAVSPGRVISLGRYTVLRLEEAKNNITVLPGDSMEVPSEVSQRIPKDIIEDEIGLGKTTIVKIKKEVEKGEYAGKGLRVIVLQPGEPQKEGDKRWIPYFQTQIEKAKDAAEKNNVGELMKLLHAMLQETVYGLKFRTLWEEDYKYMKARYDQLQQGGLMPEAVMIQVHQRLEMLSNAVEEYIKIGS